MIISYQAAGGAIKRLRLKALPRAPVISIGRVKEADICIDDPKASRINTAIRFWDDIFVVRDMNSKNGTFLNGKPLDVARLKPGDVLKIGDTEFNLMAEEGSGADSTIA